MSYMSVTPPELYCSQWRTCQGEREFLGDGMYMEEGEVFLVGFTHGAFSAFKIIKALLLYYGEWLADLQVSYCLVLSELSNLDLVGTYLFAE